MCLCLSVSLCPSVIGLVCQIIYRTSCFQPSTVNISLGTLFPFVLHCLPVCVCPSVTRPPCVSDLLGLPVYLPPTTNRSLTTHTCSSLRVPLSICLCVSFSISPSLSLEPLGLAVYLFTCHVLKTHTFSLHPAFSIRLCVSFIISPSLSWDPVGRPVFLPPSVNNLNNTYFLTACSIVYLSLCVVQYLAVIVFISFRTSCLPSFYSKQILRNIFLFPSSNIAYLSLCVLRYLVLIVF